MSQKFFLIYVIFLSPSSQAHALGEVDNYVLTRCGTACNGADTSDCRQCYNVGVDLYNIF